LARIEIPTPPFGITAKRRCESQRYGRGSRYNPFRVGAAGGWPVTQGGARRLRGLADTGLCCGTSLRFRGPRPLSLLCPHSLPLFPCHSGRIETETRCESWQPPRLTQKPQPVSIKTRPVSSRRAVHAHLRNA
jgi:hypothetical protein